MPAIEGWFTLDQNPHLIGAQCTACGTYVFPPREGACPSPLCDSDELKATPFSRFGTVWSYAENRYAPPLPYRAAEPFEPYALVAVQLETDVLYREDGVDYMVYVWAPAVQDEVAGGAK